MHDHRERHARMRLGGYARMETSEGTENGTGIESGKSEHVLIRGISRATTLSADFIG